MRTLIWSQDVHMTQVTLHIRMYVAFMFVCTYHLFRMVKMYLDIQYA